MMLKCSEKFHYYPPHQAASTHIGANLSVDLRAAA